MTRNGLMLCTGMAAVALVAACSSSGSAPTTSSSAPRSVAPLPSHSPVAHQQSSSPPAASSPATSSSATGALGGTWHGQYSGAYSGTFDLRWQQSGSKLDGTIHLSTPDDTLPITGSLSGGTISFGTVGSLAITYSGSVSGRSMSGSYQVHAGGSAGGSWSATKA